MLKLLFLLLFMSSFLGSSVFVQTPPPIEPGVSHDLAIWRAANYSDVRYKLNITLEKGAPLMTGDIEIRVNLTEEGAKNDLILDWRTTQFAADKDKPFADVVSVNQTVMGKATQSNIYDYQTTKEHLLISHRFFKTGENTIKIKFASPIKTSGAAITRYVDKEDGAEYVYSLFVPSDASTAFPVFDQSDLKARFQLNVTAPMRWKVISNTLDKHFMSSPPKTLYDWSKNLFTTEFDETQPISTYVFAFAAGEFEEFYEKREVEAIGEIGREKQLKGIVDSNGSTPVSLREIRSRNSKIYVRKSQAAKLGNVSCRTLGKNCSSDSTPDAVNEVFRLNREAIKYLESYFDYKFPFPKYDLVLIPEFPFGGMEHAGATFLREDRIIFPTEPTKNDYITRANVIFHEAAHQWFGDCVTMKWFDDLWLKEGFAEFMAYKTLEKVMPEYNAWKIFYERNKQAAYLTDVTRGTTPIYQEIPNLSAAKSAYGNIVYRKAPSFLRQAEFYLGEDKFQTAVRAFLKKHEFANAEWTDLVKEFETASKQDLKDWADVWVKQKGLPIIRVGFRETIATGLNYSSSSKVYVLEQSNNFGFEGNWSENVKVLLVFKNELPETVDAIIYSDVSASRFYSYENDNGKIKTYTNEKSGNKAHEILAIFPNYQDYGYGTFLLDEKSRVYVLANIQNEKDDFLRSMMWGSLWDSVRFYELAPADYVKLVIKNINVETDESTIQTLLGRVSTAMNYYLSDKQRDELAPQLEAALIDKMQTAPTFGQRITFYRAFLNAASSEKARVVLKDILSGKLKIKELELKTKDKFDLVTRLIVLGDKDALNILAALEKQNTDDAAKRYAYAARAGIPTAENKLKYWNDFTNNKDISESYIESAFAVWNTPRQADLTLPYLEKALAELPNLKKNRKIFFVNGWLSAFIGEQKSVKALNVINKFLADNPHLDKDLRNKILENSDNLERAVKIRAKFDQK